MKKLLSLLSALLFVWGFVSCSNEMQEEIQEYGSIIIGSSEESRELDVSELSISSVKVYGYGIATVNGTVSDFSDGSGTATITNIPVGRRVIEIASNKTGAVLYKVLDVAKGDNGSVSVDWSTTAVGKVYYEIQKTKEIKSIEETKFSSAIDTSVHPSLIDAEAIASDYLSRSLKSASSYVLETGAVTATVYGYEGATLQIADPSSESVTGPANGGTVTFTNVYPGKWNVYADGEKVKTITVFSGTNIAVIGSSITGKTVIFANGTTSKIYAWGATSETKYAGEWPGTEAKAATSDMMNDPTGWVYVDISSVYGTSTEKIKFILLDSSENKIFGAVDLESGVSGTFWYDAAGTYGTAQTVYTSDPTTVKISSDTTLKSISVNGSSIGTVGTTNSYEIASSVTSVTVTAVANDDAATVSISPNGTTEIAEGATKAFVITVTAEDGTVATYTVNVTRKEAVVDDVSLESVKVNGSAATASGTTYSFTKTGTDESLAISSIVATPTDSGATVTYSTKPTTVASGTPASVTITVTNGSKSATYSLTISYTYKETPTNQYYWTNKNGYGTNKTITGLSSWSESEKIIQGVACDTPRCWLGGHEYPDPDLYAMFAAYDDTNLYLLIEIPNVDDADAVDNDKCYAGSQFLPMGVVLNTGKRVAGSGLLVDGNSVWQNSELYTWDITESGGIDTMLMFHPRLNIGKPSIFKTNSSGKFTYDDDSLCIGFAKAGVKREIFFNECVSTSMWAAVTLGTDDKGKTVYNWGSKSSTDMSSYTYVDYMSSEFGKKMSAYQITIPLSALDIDKSYIESTGISVGCFSTYGASAMDCLPWDECMIDNAAESYSSDPSSSKEKEDKDNITTELARIGHAK